MKKILGLDLGTTSIGWAFVKESNEPSIHSTIERLGVRVNPLTTDELINFEKGKPITINADRTLKRSMRRNLQRYKLRRSNLINALINANIISSETPLAEFEKSSTHSTYKLRAKAAIEQIGKDQFAKVLLMLNKKRGYKSSRKVKFEEEGQAIDGMQIAKSLYEENLTPGQLSYQLLKEGKVNLPDFYRSDLINEFELVWNFQMKFYPEVLNNEFKSELIGKGQRATSFLFANKHKIISAENKGTREEKKRKAYEWRSDATKVKLSIEEVAYVIIEINNNINNSSGYLGAISDRSKELFFTNKTIGQYLYSQLETNPHARLKNQVFYRQDYFDEFERIWETQNKFHPELTTNLKEEIRDIIIFYQRKLKSQKSRISFCEFESTQIEKYIEGKSKNITIGYKVSPKSSPLFQEFKIWQILNNIEVQNKKTQDIFQIGLEIKIILFQELNLKGNLSGEQILKLIGCNPLEWALNYSTIEGNRTNRILYEAYLKIIENEGYDVKELLNVKSNKDDFKLSDIEITAQSIIKIVKSIFEVLNIETSILDFNADIDGKLFEKQKSYQLWHLLYSFEGDNSTSGNELLYKSLQNKFGFNQDQAKIIGNLNFQEDYSNLSAKAIKNIFPFIKENKYSEACKLAGYNHSSSLTREENEKRVLKEKLDLLPKNSLRNPVVEKILNQMVNLVNTIINDPLLGKPDEIRIELARELKKNSEERAEMTASINKSNIEHEAIKQILKKEDGIKNPTRNDIIRYKLYVELKNNGYKTLYSNTYIPREKLFSKEFDIEHIIPKALLFDDSFSNKTLCSRKENLEKANRCAYDFIGHYFGEDKIEEYVSRIGMLHQLNIKNPGEGINKAKFKKLLLKSNDIGKGFIERDLRDSQYIAKKAKVLLQEICKTVVSTTGSVTDKLREDWGLINIMQELNFEKYKKQGLIEVIEKNDGSTKERIIDWSKRNDHRHHAMDALTVAFTKHSHIQYLNNLNARKNDDKLGKEIYAIEQKETSYEKNKEGNGKRKFNLPLPNFRIEAKKHLETILISCKAKNKVVTKNKNKFKTKNGEKIQIELTPRGQLHKETIYGSIKQYVLKEEKIGSKFDEETILKIANLQDRMAILNRLKENNGDPKKAFTGKNSLDKNPIFYPGQNQIKVAEKIKMVTLEEDFTIRKDITPDNFKDLKSIEKIIDVGVKKILLKRIETFNGNFKEAFSNLDIDPIWLNQSKGISIKKVTISGVKNADALHFKKDHFGKLILDNKGNKIGCDFVSTGNNHHVAIYKDLDGNLQDNIVSFYEAVERARQGLPIIDKNLNGWSFQFSLKQNEYFIFPNEGFDPLEIDLLDSKNNKLISPNLFRVQKISKNVSGNSFVREFMFRHHLETIIEDKKELQNITFKRIQSLLPLNKIVKVRINHIGQIIKIGEY